MSQNTKPSAAILTAIGILGRLLPHLPNFTPVGGASLFGGAKLSRPWNYLLPLGIMAVTDVFLGFHKTMPYVYGSFLAIVWMGEWGLKNNSSWLRIGSLSLAGSLLFFLVTNFGVWQAGGMYAHTWAGLLQCYAMGIPFFRATLTGDLLYSAGFFGVYQLATNTKYIEQFDKAAASWLRSK